MAFKILFWLSVVWPCQGSQSVAYMPYMNLHGIELRFNISDEDIEC